MDFRFFYTVSFENGESLIEAMESRVKQSTFFVLFASTASAKSHWVNFEIDRARLQKITNERFRIFVFPIDRKLQRNELPRWMSEYWIPNAGGTQRDIARFIRNSVLFYDVIGSPAGKAYGRGQLRDVALEQFNIQTVQAERSPNILVLAGLNGIGRRTFCREFIDQAYPAAPNLKFGPQLSLPNLADIEDVYRSLRQEIDAEFSLSEFEKDRQIFIALDTERKVEEVVANLQHFFDLGQAVTFVTRGGIYEDRGTLKSWVDLIFKKLAVNVRAKLFFIVERQIHDNELRKHNNVIQFHVPSLKESSIETIIISMLPLFGAKPVLPRSTTMRAIGGHPAIAKMAARLIAQQGVGVFEDDPKNLFDIQDDILRASLDIKQLSDTELEVLSVLSWLPSLPTELLGRLIATRHGLEKEKLAEILSKLVMACYIMPEREVMMISSAIRSFFRRSYGYGSSELRASLFNLLKDEWNKARTSGHDRFELFDAFIFMAALEGGTLPSEFKSLIPASTLLELVRETYDNGHEDTKALERVIDWSQPAFSMKMDETVREEILSYLIRALIRLRNKDQDVDKALQYFSARGYRSFHFLNGFYLRRRGNPKEAILSFNESRRAKKYIQSTIGELGECYKVLAMWPELRALIKEQGPVIDRNPDLLDTYAGMLIAEKDWSAAEDVIRRLKAAPRSEGRAESRAASILVQRDGNYKEAARILSQVLLGASHGKDNIRRARALASVQGGDIATAKADIEILKSRVGGAELVRRIEALIMLAEGDAIGSLEHLRASNQLTAQDRLVEARILDAMSHEVLRSMSERNQLKQEAVELRIRYSISDEL